MTPGLLIASLRRWFSKERPAAEGPAGQYARTTLSRPTAPRAQALAAISLFDNSTATPALSHASLLFLDDAGCRHDGSVTAAPSIAMSRIGALLRLAIEEEKHAL